MADIVAKVPNRQELIFLLLKKSTTTADSCALNRVTEIVSQFIVRRGGPPHLYTKIACTAKRNFNDECKRTFATRSARTGHEQVQQNLLMMLQRRLSCLGRLGSLHF